MRSIILLLSVVIFSCNTHSPYWYSEKNYFEGQRDAINGDIRIRLNNDSVYMWVKSPWNNRREIEYNPTYLDSKPSNGFHKMAGEYQLYLDKDSMYMYDQDRRVAAFAYDSSRICTAILNDNR